MCNNCQGSGTIRIPTIRRVGPLYSAGRLVRRPRVRVGAPYTYVKCMECGPPNVRSPYSRSSLTRLADVGDVKAYCWGAAQRITGRIHTPVDTPSIREERLHEAHAESVALAYRIWNEWDPNRCQSFKLFLSARLDQRMHDWWRKDQAQRGVAYKPREGPWQHREALTYEAMEELSDNSYEARHVSAWILPSAFALIESDRDRALALRVMKEWIRQGLATELAKVNHREAAQRLGLSQVEYKRLRLLILDKCNIVRGREERAC